MENIVNKLASQPLEKFLDFLDSNLTLISYL